MPHIAIMLLTVLNTVAPHTEVHTTATRRPQASDGAYIPHTSANYRLLRAWCEENPSQCVRVGNTYIVQGR